MTALEALRAKLESRAKPWCSSRTWEDAWREGMRDAIAIVEACSETARRDDLLDILERARYAIHVEHYSIAVDLIDEVKGVLTGSNAGGGE